MPLPPEGSEHVTRRKHLEYWTEVKRVVGDAVKVTTCCCAAPGATAKGCSIVAGNKSRCGCYCHSRRILRRDGSKLAPTP